jgi:hypothetical protein
MNMRPYICVSREDSSDDPHVHHHHQPFDPSAPQIPAQTERNPDKHNSKVRKENPQKEKELPNSTK